MKRTKTLIAFLCVIAIIVLSMVAIISTTDKSEVQAASISMEKQSDTVLLTRSEASERGWFTYITASLTGGNSYVTAVAKNEFTLFPSTIRVIVTLYSSNTYQENIANMTLESTATTDNLDIFATLEASAYTGGVQKYWRGRVEYKFDNDDWATLETATVLCNGDGTVA